LVPNAGLGIGSLQGSTLLVALGTMTSGCGVGVGNGVKVSVGVGGMGDAVAVGIAALVRLTSVHAAAMAVFAMSAGLTVGVDALPHDASEMMMSVETSDRIFFFIFFSKLLSLRGACGAGDEAISSRH